MSKSSSPATVSFQERLGLALLRLSARFPLWLSRSLGSLAGWVMWLSRGRMYQATRVNLELCLPELGAAERGRLLRASLRETAKTALETGAVWLQPPEWVLSRIGQVHGREVLDEALARGKGVILLAPHLGNWEAFGPYLSQIPGATFLYQPPDNPELERIMREGRERAGARIVPTNRRGVLALLQVIKTGGFTGILPDQVPDAAGGEFAPFFGVPALTMTLVNSLRQRTGAMVIAGYAERVRGGFDIHFQRAAEGIDADDELVALTAMNRTVENCVRAVPAQYQWEYKRFRKRLPGRPNPYKKAKA